MTDRPDPADEHLDRVLDDYAQRWQQATDQPSAAQRLIDGLTADLAEPAARPTRYRPVWLAAAAAAAVIIGFVVMAQLQSRSLVPGGSPAATTSTSTTSTTSTPTASTTTPSASPSAATVPWADLPATNPTYPTTTPTANPAQAAGAPPCTAGQLFPSTPRIGAAAGTTYLDVLLSLDGTTSCALTGPATITSLHNGAVVDIPTAAQINDAGYTGALLVTADQPADLRLSWSNWCTTAVTQDNIRISLPDGGGTLTVPGFGHSPGCLGTAGQGPSPIGVESFFPAQLSSPYDVVRLAGSLDVTAAANSTATFTVTVTAPRNLVLAPCPDYTISVNTPTGGDHPYALNCAAVPTKDSQGHPMLPAGQPVTFQFQVPTGSQSGTLTWSFGTPADSGRLPGLTGRLTIQ